MQIVLLVKVRLIVFAHIVVDEGDGYDERNGAPPIEVGDLEQFLFLVRGKLLLEVTQDVRQNVRIFLRCGFETESLHEQFLVLLMEVFQGDIFCPGHQLPHYPVMLGAVGED